MNYQNNGSWDARIYDQVSYLVQYKWGQQADPERYCLTTDDQAFVGLLEIFVMQTVL